MDPMGLSYEETKEKKTHAEPSSLVCHHQIELYLTVSSTTQALSSMSYYLPQVETIQ